MSEWFLDPRFHTPGYAERRLKELREEKKYQAPLPANTLTNADGTPYSAGHDEEKPKAELDAEAEAMGKRIQDFVHAEVEAYFKKHRQHMAWSFNLEKLTGGGFWERNILQFFGQINK